jgi:hypothetical protein
MDIDLEETDYRMSRYGLLFEMEDYKENKTNQTNRKRLPETLPDSDDDDDEDQDCIYFVLSPPPPKRHQTLRAIQRNQQLFEEACLMMTEASLLSKDKLQKVAKTLWVCDSGASTHMGPSDNGMRNAVDSTATIKIGSGKVLEAIKTGDKHCFIKQPNSEPIEVVLEGYQQVPGLWVNLFSLTSAIKNGWSIGNQGKMITVKKGSTTIVFDKILNTGSGYLCGVEMEPVHEEAHPMMQVGHSIDINKFHSIFNHASPSTCKHTAETYGVKLVGEFKPCIACKVANARKTDVPKSTATKANSNGERMFFDISGVAKKSYGGRKFWAMLLDDHSNITHSIFVKKKSDIVELIVDKLKEFKKKGTAVKYLRMDNSGENKALKQAIDADPELDIEVEFTPPNTPEFNGKIERRFAYLFGCLRANLNAAEFDEKMRYGLWCECAVYTETVANSLITPRRLELDQLTANSMAKIGLVYIT